LGEIPHPRGTGFRDTVWLRISLWKTALIAFWSDPLTGIGPGNYRNVDAIFPFLKFDAARLYVLGLLLAQYLFSYLAETGILAPWRWRHFILRIIGLQDG